MRSTLLAGASRFAHFGGLTRRGQKAEDDNDYCDDENDDEAKGGRGKRGKAEGDDDEKKDDDDQPSGKRGKRSRADDDQDDDDGKKDDDDPSSKRGKAEGDDDEKKDDDDRPSGKRGKRSRADDDQDDDEDDEDDDRREMSGSSAAAQARRRERARCAAIFACPAAARNVELAASLAFETTMTRQEAIKVLSKQPKHRQDDDRRSDRSQRNPTLGNEGPKPNSQQAAQASWGEAFKKAGVTTR